MTPTSDVTSRAALIFLSYRFSQGAVGSQNRLLLLLEERWAPALFDHNHLPAVRRAVRRIVGDYFLDDRLHPAAAFPWTNGATGAAAKSDAVVTNELAGLFRRFEHREELASFSPRSGRPRREPHLHGRRLPAAAKRPRHRRRAPAGRPPAPATPDPWRSGFAAHALLGRPTGRAEYDALFGLLGDDRILAGLGPSDRSALRRVVDRFSHHSDLDADERTRLEDAVRERI